MSKHHRSESTNFRLRVANEPLARFAGSAISIGPFELNQVPLSDAAYIGLLVSHEEGHMPTVDSIPHREERSLRRLW
jgi:hypothetical protein